MAQRARTADGAWLVVRSAPLGARRGIVTIDEAGPPDVVAILSAALGLSSRETDRLFDRLTELIDTAHSSDIEGSNADA